MAFESEPGKAASARNMPSLPRLEKKKMYWYIMGEVKDSPSETSAMKHTNVVIEMWFISKSGAKVLKNAPIMICEYGFILTVSGEVISKNITMKKGPIETIVP